MIESYVSKNPEKSVSFASLGQLRYLSALKYVDCVVGNSSSGIIEAPSLKTATVNIGDRQKGRIKGATVLQCLPIKKEIMAAIKKAISKEFRQILVSGSSNPYGTGNSSDLILKNLKSVKLDNILKKCFNDL